MTHSHEHREQYSLDLPFGLLLGLFAGALAGILFAPKPGRELQDDLQHFVNRLPDELSDRMSTSKTKYKELVGKTRYSLENKLEKRSQRKVAHRMAEAKQREDQEAGNFEY